MARRRGRRGKVEGSDLEKIVEQGEVEPEATMRRSSRRRAERVAHIEAARRKRRNRIVAMVTLIVAIVIVGSTAAYVVKDRLGGGDGNGDGGGNGGNGNGPASNPIAVMETSMGTIEIELYMEFCPETAGNFKSLADQDFYDGLTFHRIVEGFMIQGGDPQGDGTGGPGYSIQDEPSALSLPHNRGSISMANSGPNTGGSQFFICVDRADWLDGQHAVFGRVRSGMTVVDEISREPVDENNRPYQTIWIDKVYTI